MVCTLKGKKTLTFIHLNIVLWVVGWRQGESEEEGKLFAKRSGFCLRGRWNEKCIKSAINGTHFYGRHRCEFNLECSAWLGHLQTFSNLLFAFLQNPNLLCISFCEPFFRSPALKSNFAPKKVRSSTGFAWKLFLELQLAGSLPHIFNCFRSRTRGNFTFISSTMREVTSPIPLIDAVNMFDSVGMNGWGKETREWIMSCQRLSWLDNWWIFLRLSCVHNLRWCCLSSKRV